MKVQQLQSYCQLRPMYSFKCSRMFSIVSGIVLIVLGIISLAVSIWMLTSDNWSTIFSYQINLLCTFMIVAACIMIIGGFYGTWAAYRTSNTHLSVFFGVMIISTLLLLVSGVLGVALPLRIATAGCGAPIYPIIAGLNITATQAINTICQTCTCFINNTIMQGSFVGYNIDTVNSAQPTKAQACTSPAWNKTAYDDLYASLETTFSCSGWCPGTQGVMYKMTNTNGGTPSSSCFEATTYWFQIFSRTISISAFVFAALIIVLMGLLWWHLCEVVDMETEAVLLRFGKMANPSQATINNVYEMSNISYLPPQPVPLASQPVSPNQQFIPGTYPPGMLESVQSVNYPANYPMNYPIQGNPVLQSGYYGPAMPR